MHLQMQSKCTHILLLQLHHPQNLSVLRMGARRKRPRCPKPKPKRRNLPAPNRKPSSPSSSPTKKRWKMLGNFGARTVGLI